VMMMVLPAKKSGVFGMVFGASLRGAGAPIVPRRRVGHNRADRRRRRDATASAMRAGGS